MSPVPAVSSRRASGTITAATGRCGCSGQRPASCSRGSETNRGWPGRERATWRSLLGEAGLGQIEEATLSVSIEHPSFDDWWEPYTLGVGPAGAFLASLDPARQAELRELCRAQLPDAPFVLTARCWAARGAVSGERAHRAHRSPRH